MSGVSQAEVKTDLPPLPSQRGLEDFVPNQSVLMLAEDILVEGKVEGVVAYAAEARAPSPGFLRIFSTAQANTGLLTPQRLIDINRSEVIPLDALGVMSADDRYRKEYLSDGPDESIRNFSVLEKAIKEYLAEHQPPEDREQEAEERKRARSRLHARPSPMATDCGICMSQAQEEKLLKFFGTAD